MKCPSCNEYAPDANYKCPQCGAVLKQGLDPQTFKKTAQIKSASNKTTLFVLITILLVAIGIFFKFISSKNDNPPVREKTVSREALLAKKRGNSGSTNEMAAKPKDTPAQVIEDENVLQETGPLEEQPVISSIENHVPGEKIDIERIVEIGKINIFDFYSEYCEPCKEISPLLKKLAQKRRDIVVFKIDINRDGIGEIDWQSPVSKQYNLGRMPSYIIYDKEARRSHEGQAASDEVLRLINSEGVR